MMQQLRRILVCKKGQGLVEYGILVGGIALVCLAAVAILGHKANDLLAITAAALPGAHADDNGAIISGKLVQTVSAGGGLTLDTANPGTIADNLGIPNAGLFSVEP